MIRFKLLPKDKRTPEDKMEFDHFCRGVASNMTISFQAMTGFLNDVAEEFCQTMPSHKLEVRHDYNSCAIQLKMTMDCLEKLWIPPNPDYPNFKVHEAYVPQGSYIGNLFDVSLSAIARESKTMAELIARRFKHNTFDYIIKQGLDFRVIKKEG